MKERGKHVVNDFIGGIPVTVTYCDINSCARAFTADGNEALDIGVGGLEDGKMVLVSGGKRFQQNVENAPIKVSPRKTRSSYE